MSKGRRNLPRRRKVGGNKENLVRSQLQRFAGSLRVLFSRLSELRPRRRRGVRKSRASARFPLKKQVTPRLIADLIFLAVLVAMLALSARLSEAMETPVDTAPKPRSGLALAHCDLVLHTWLLPFNPIVVCRDSGKAPDVSPSPAPKSS